MTTHVDCIEDCTLTLTLSWAKPLLPQPPPFSQLDWQWYVWMIRQDQDGDKVQGVGFSFCHYQEA